MIITYLKASNLYGFNNTEIDFSYTRKVVDSSIEYEYLPERKNFNFKRVCIISGTNASGKTSLGRVICGIENFLSRKTIIPTLASAICDSEQPASIEFEFVTPTNNIFHKLDLSFVDSGVAVKRLQYISLPIGKNDSCSTMRKKLLQVVENKKARNGVYISSDEVGVSTAFEKFSELSIEDLSWMFMFSENQNENKIASPANISASLFKKILKAFDPSIESVEALTPANESEKKRKNRKGNISGYLIKFNNGDSVLINSSGEMTADKDDINRFSKGTYDAIKLTSFISRVFVENKFDGSCTHFLDEQMAYTHSDLEQHILNLIVSKLSPLSQFFYTTHNYDVLDMGFPVHSYLFMRKENSTSSVIQPESSFKKNDRSLLNYVKNDYFNTLPDTSDLDKLLWE